jgi:hypothetical protein
MIHPGLWLAAHAEKTFEQLEMDRTREVLYFQPNLQSCSSIRAC